MPARKLIAYSQWKKVTYRRFKSRSHLLKAVDSALERYEKACEGLSVEAAASSRYHSDVNNAFTAWKASKGVGDAWKHSQRDGNRYFTLLDNQLKGVGDTDRALGVVDFLCDEMVHARLGALYLFSRLECDDSMFSVALEGSLDITKSSLDYADVSYDQTKLNVASTVADLGVKKAESAILAREGKKSKTSSSELLVTVQPPMSERLRNIWELIRNKVLEYSAKIIEAIKRKLDDIRDKVVNVASNPVEAIMDNLGTILRKLVDSLTSRFLADAAPFIGASLDIVGGILNTFDAGVTKFKEWLNGREVLLSSGHITVIVESIKRAMTLSIGSGLYATLKGGINLGSQFMTAGASAIISLISSIIEAVVKTVWKIIEIGRMRAFFKEARGHWESKQRADALHRRPIAFNQWFKSYSLSLPVLSVLALNTGITGNRMLFLQMYKSDTKIISQSQYDKGGSYLDGLKNWGSGYLEDTGFNFSSADPVVEGLLKLAKNQNAPLSSRENTVRIVKQFANA